MFINISIQINSDYIILHLIFTKKKIKFKKLTLFMADLVWYAFNICQNKNQI